MQGNKNNLWEIQYSKTENNLWGFKPVDTLVNYTDSVLGGGKVLDLGMGEGRNLLYFASKGFETEGIDISETAVNRCKQNAKKAELKVKAEVSDLISYHIKENTYSLIILSNVLNFFNDVQIDKILDKAKRGLKKGGLIYINVFDTNDPGYEKNKKNSQQVSNLTFFRAKSNSYIHFFTKEELHSHFMEYQIIKQSQTYLLDVGHGEPHYHGIIELLIQK